MQNERVNSVQSTTARCCEHTSQAAAVDVAKLFGERRQVRLLHGGQEYLLQITRNGKLILTK